MLRGQFYRLFNMQSIYFPNYQLVYYDYDLTYCPMKYGYVSSSMGSIYSSNPSHLTSGGLQAPQKPRLWTGTELSQHPCLGTIDDATQYRIAAYLSTNSPDLVPARVSAMEIPLEVLLPRISRSIMTEVAIRHYVTTSRRHIRVETLLGLFDNHDCATCGCGTFWTLLEPVKQNEMGSNRTAKWRASIAENEEKLEKQQSLAQERMSTYRAGHAFPPGPPTHTVQEQVIRGFCDDIEFEKLHE